MRCLKHERRVHAFLTDKAKEIRTSALFVPHSLVQSTQLNGMDYQSLLQTLHELIERTQSYTNQQHVSLKTIEKAAYLGKAPQ